MSLRHLLLQNLGIFHPEVLGHLKLHGFYRVVQRDTGANLPSDLGLTRLAKATAARARMANPAENWNTIAGCAKSNSQP